MPSGPYGCVAVLAVILAGPALELRPNDFFTRGDVDQSGRLDVTDAVRVLLGLFAGDGASLRCEAAADANDDDIVSVADAIYVLRALFQAGPAPPAPFPDCGFDTMARGNARRNLIFFVQSSRGTCNGADEAEYLNAAVEEITRANGGGARIHTFSLHPVDSRRREFLTKLAEANGGAYRALWEVRD